MRRRARHITDGGRSGPGASRALLALLLSMLIALMSGVCMVGTAQAADAARGDSSNSMHVVVPVPSADGKTVSGPVGANISVSSSQATAGATYSLGWASSSDGCASATTFSDGATSVTADNGGNFSATFVWPADAGTAGALYVICATDTADSTDVITADQEFQVLGATAPTVSLSQAPSSAETGKTFDAGGPVQAQGQGFLPQGTSVDIFVTTSQTFSTQDFQPDNALKTQDGSQITSDSSGAFTAVVMLPKIITGELFLHAVSTDAVTTGTTPFPPSLVADTTIHISQPQPTPTPTTQPSPTATHASTGGSHTPPTTSKKYDHSKRIAAIATLGGLSLILFIVGVILIASAALGPRTPPAFDNGSRPFSDGVRSGPQW